MVEAWAAVAKHPREASGIAGAGTEVQSRPAPSKPSGGGEEPLNIDGVGASFQSMQDDEARTAGGALDMIEDEIVSVGRRKDLADECDSPARPRDGSPCGLQVRSRQPPRGTKERVHVRIE